LTPIAIGFGIGVGIVTGTFGLAVAAILLINSVERELDHPHSLNYYEAKEWPWQERKPA
jgi:hypothetical protein